MHSDMLRMIEHPERQEGSKKHVDTLHPHRQKPGKTVGNMLLDLKKIWVF